MEEHDPQRRAARYRLDRLAELDAPSGRDGATGHRAPATPSGASPSTPAHRSAPADRSAPAHRAGPGDPADAPSDARPGPPRPESMAARRAFADELVRQAMARGEFDDLPLAGKPIPGLTGRYDPDWWLKAFIEREQITGVLPEALQLRKDDVELDDRLDRLGTEAQVREAVEEFNTRIVEARRQLLGGPPVVTPTRDVDGEVARWSERRRARQAAARVADDARSQAGAPRPRRVGPWWRRQAP